MIMTKNILSLIALISSFALMIGCSNDDPVSGGSQLGEVTASASVGQSMGGGGMNGGGQGMGGRGPGGW